MFTLFLAFLGLALFFGAHAWDGLVRRRALLAPFPRGAAFGGQSLLLKRMGSLTVGTLAALLALGCLIMAAGSWAVALQEGCHENLSMGCVGALAAGVALPGWIWFGLCLGWFVFVWLLLGNPYQRVLVYGAWYNQRQVAHLLRDTLVAQGLPPLADERLYTLEDQVRLALRRLHWLDYGHMWLDGARYTPVAPQSAQEMTAIVLRRPTFQGANASEQAVVAFLLTYFLTQARQAQQRSPLRRFLIGRLQFGKMGGYGGNAL